MIATRNISHVTYRCWEPEVAFAFFVEVLGFSPRRRGKTRYVLLGETLVEIGQAPVELGALPEEPGSYVFGVAVADLDGALRELAALGVAVMKPVWSGNSFWGRQAVIAVPGGPQLALREWEAPDGPDFDDWQPRARS